MTGKDVLESRGRTVGSLVDYLMKPIESPLGSGFVNNHVDPVLGYQIEFFERNGFDFGDDMIAYGDWFRQAVNDFLFPEQEGVWYGSPNFTGQNLSDEELRLVGIDVRNFIRQKFDMPLLTEVAADSWVMHFDRRNDFAVSLADTRLHRNDDGSELHYVRPTKEQAETVMQFFKERYPDCYRLYVVMKDFGSIQGYNGITGFDFNWLSQKPYRDVLDNCAEICFGSKLKSNQKMNAYAIEQVLDEEQL